MNPLGWSLGWAVVVVLAATVLWLAGAAAWSYRRGPLECPRCVTPVPRERQVEHDRMHAELDEAFEAAKVEHFEDVCSRVFGDDPTPHIGGAA